MTTQLTLLPSATPAITADGPAPWQLDATTRAVGREGLAEARRALADAKTRCGDTVVAIDPFSHAA